MFIFVYIIKAFLFDSNTVTRFIFIRIRILFEVFVFKYFLKYSYSNSFELFDPGLVYTLNSDYTSMSNGSCHYTPDAGTTISCRDTPYTGNNCCSMGLAHGRQSLITNSQLIWNVLKHTYDYK